MRHDVGEGSVEGALTVEGALELQEGAVPLVGGLLGQRERLLAAHRVVPEMKRDEMDRFKETTQTNMEEFGHVFKLGHYSKCLEI